MMLYVELTGTSAFHKTYRCISHSQNKQVITALCLISSLQMYKWGHICFLYK